VVLGVLFKAVGAKVGLIRARKALNTAAFDVQCTLKACVSAAVEPNVHTIRGLNWWSVRRSLRAETMFLDIVRVG
jgi:hypothetical protein